MKLAKNLDEVREKASQIIGMNLIIPAAIDANDFASQFLHFLCRAFKSFAIPEMLGAYDGNANGFSL